MTSSLKHTVIDYWTLLKPSVMSLVIFTACCGFLLAPGGVSIGSGFLSLLAIAIGSGGAGVLNMWYEREVDAKMVRTQKRPLPRQSISAENALFFGLSLSFISVFTLSLSANLLAGTLLAFTIFFYGMVYTMWLKPRTPQNIVIGGAAGAFPPLIGWIVVDQSFAWFPILLFLIIFFWTPVHFWALALNRVDDYSKANLPMMPSVVGKKKTCEQMFLYALLTLIVSILPYFMEILSTFYLLAALALGGYLVYLSHRVWKKDLRLSRKLFGYSIAYLFCLFLIMLFDRWLFS